MAKKKEKEVVSPVILEAAITLIAIIIIFVFIVMVVGLTGI